MGTLCQDFFENNAEPQKELVPKLIATGNGLEWSDLTASKFSPGVVANEEKLCRQVVHPAFYDEANDEVTNTLYDDVCSRGMSTNRLNFGTEADFIEHGNRRLGGESVRVWTSQFFSRRDRRNRS